MTTIRSQKDINKVLSLISEESKWKKLRELIEDSDNKGELRKNIYTVISEKEKILIKYYMDYKNRFEDIERIYLPDKVLVELKKYKHENETWIEFLRKILILEVKEYREILEKTPWIEEELPEEVELSEGASEIWRKIRDIN